MADIEYITRLAEEYKKSKETLDLVEKRTNSIKKELSDFLIENGTPDDRGSMWAMAGEYSLKRERRISNYLDIDAVTAWAKETGIWDEVKEVVEVLSEDRLLAYAWDNPEQDNTIQSFYKEREVWAFKIS